TCGTVSSTTCWSIRAIGYSCDERRQHGQVRGRPVLVTDPDCAQALGRRGPNAEQTIVEIGDARPQQCELGVREGAKRFHPQAEISGEDCLLLVEQSLACATGDPVEGDMGPLLRLTGIADRRVGAAIAPRAPVRPSFLSLGDHPNSWHGWHAPQVASSQAG